MSATAAPGRLETWRQIGDFIGKDERTAKRWETARGMPVHRVPGGGKAAVYAFAEELDAWLARAKTPPSGHATPPEAAAEAEPPGPRSRAARLVWIGSALVLLIGAVGLWFLTAPPKHATRDQAPADAIDLYRQGRVEWGRRTPDSLRRALRLFTRAAERDPLYADAYVGLADTYNLLREYTAMPDDQAYPRAKWAARRAATLDPGSASALAALAFDEFYWDWDIQAARNDFTRAIALDPANAAAHHWYANAMSLVGDGPTALKEIERAEALAPESLSIRADKGLILIKAGQNRRAEAMLQALARSSPAFLSPHYYLQYLFFEEGRYADYIRELRVVAALKEDDGARRIADASEAGLRAGGPQEMVARRLAVEEALAADGRLTEFQVALAAAEAGRDAAAIDHLAAAAVRHDPNVLGARSAVAFARLRTQPAFVAALAAVPR